MRARFLHDSTHLISFKNDHYRRLSFFRLPRPASWNPPVITSSWPHELTITYTRTPIIFFITITTGLIKLDCPTSAFIYWESQYCFQLCLFCLTGIRQINFPMNFACTYKSMFCTERFHSGKAFRLIVEASNMHHLTT